MGNTTHCSTKPSSPSKRTSHIYKLETNSPLPTNVHHYKEQIHSQPLLFHFTCKESQHYKSQINVNTQQTPVPMCIGRGWLKKQVKRPISLDLDLVKTIVQQPSINNHEQLLEEQQQPLNNIGNSTEKKTDKAEILVAKQIVDMPIMQTGKYFSKQHTYP
ncbi:unnamed protein product [Rotaria sordida]|uniref:Uncharacterized protein n=1 Tax=Rotaria sordida TaxID=392033 RepID=A0A813TH92_9BILA|nr:unnamed protein product [Rotaria sordida]CAF0809337.1 unnamed protein product [Rotaria sordida]CAF0814530.1 unnamed protein product [Rotaria sordida]CAF0859091.1 unnamed protein product [Rotaria sordida]CAF0864139.1 unnamed protein product [Rotaria sordida]